MTLLPCPFYGRFPYSNGTWVSCDGGYQESKATNTVDPKSGYLKVAHATFQLPIEHYYKEHTMTDYEKLKDFFLTNGWRNYPTPNPVYPETRRELWAKKSGVGPNFCVVPVTMNIHGNNTDFISIDLTGEVNDIWFKLEAYSLSIDDFLKNHKDIEASLLKSWSAL